MARITLHDIDDELKSQLKHRATRHGVSLQIEARKILRDAVATEADDARLGLGSRIAARFATHGLNEPLAEWRGGAPQTPIVKS